MEFLSRVNPDLLKAIDEAIDDKEVEKLIYKIRADLKWDK